MRISFENYWKFQRSGSFVMPFLFMVCGKGRFEVTLLGFGIQFVRV